MKIIIKNGRIIDPYNKVDMVADIGVSDGVIVDPSDLCDSPDLQTFDASECIVTPGLIDMHVHLREPGQEYKEDIGTGTKAAAAGGFTKVLLMPNTQPPTDSVEAVKDLDRRIAESAVVETLKSACITKQRAGVELTDIVRLREETDIVALTDDGDCVQSYDLMLRAMELAYDTDLPVIDHCEDCAINAGGAMRDGEISKLLDVPGMPGEAESNIVARNIELSRKTGARIHIQHISFHKSVELVRRAQEDGLPVTAEVTPHHLVLTHDILPIMGTNAKMNPPLGTENDRQVLLEAVADGTINTIATDHAPHSPAEKVKNFVDAPFGIIGLETALSLCLTELVLTNILTLSELVSRFTVGPSSVLNLRAGGLRSGERADVTIFDHNKSYNIDINETCSKSRNSPFHNKTVYGEITGVLCGGKWAIKRPVE